MRRLDYDELLKMDEHELNRIFNNLTRRIERTRDRGSREFLETELCYVHRELEVRRARKIAHINYTASLENRRRNTSF